MQLYKLLKILILNLKRLKTNKIFNICSSYFSGGISKINIFVDFPGPSEDLDMSSYCITTNQNKKENMIYTELSLHPFKNPWKIFLRIPWKKYINNNDINNDNNLSSIFQKTEIKKLTDTPWIYLNNNHILYTKIISIYLIILSFIHQQFTSFNSFFKGLDLNKTN